LEDALEEAEARLDGKDAEMAATIQGLKDLCAAYLNMIGENKDVNHEQGQKIAEILVSLTEIRNELADNAEWQASMTTVTNQLTTGIADLWVALDLLGTEFQESLDKAVALLTAEDDAIRAEIKAGLAEIYRLAILNDDSISERLAMHTDKLNKKIDELAARVTELVNRVQSVVFVPETSDNFAYIHAAEIYASNDQKESVGYLPRISTIKYKVNAKDAAAVAKEIAANYKAVLDYDVIDVTTRGAAKSGADLEIVNVTSDGQYIFVEVMAKNFSTEGFYANRDDDDGIYSAALVLGDGNNFRSTEYTNLVADVDDAYEFLVGYIDADGMPTFAYDALHTKTFIPCNDNVNVHTAKAPEAFFRNLASGTFLTEAEFASYGYGYLASVEKLSVVTEHDPLHEPDIISGVYEDFPGNGIWEATLEYFHIAENPEFDYNINVKDLGENPWKYKGNYIKVAYEYTVAGVTVDATHDYILANAVIYVNVGTEISEGVFSTVVPWTVALEEAGYNGTTLNAKDITFSDVKWYGIDNLQEVLAGKVNYSDPRTSYKRRAIIGGVAETEWTTLPCVNENRFFTLSNYDDDKDELDIVMKGGRYSWNNEYEITYVSTDNVLNIDAVTTINVKLIGKPAEIPVLVETTFEAVKDQQWFAGQVDLSAAAYAKFFNDVDENNVIDYLGYGESNATKWAALYETWRTAYTAKTYGEPVVNDKPGARRNLWALLDNTYSPIASEARLYADDNIIYTRPGALTTVNPNKITLTVTPWFGVPVKFTVEGEVALPANKLIFSDEHVQVLANGTGRAEAVGQIGTDGKYSIILSDLAKYFNVTEELKTNMKVVFEVTDPAIAAKVKVAPYLETSVEKKTTGTYNFLAKGNAVLDWNEFQGTEVPVKATLISEDFVELGSLNLVVWTKDPLTLKGAEGTVNNEGKIVYEVARYPRKDAVAPVFKNLVATSVVEGNTNLIDVNALTIDDAFKQSQAKKKYGAELDITMGAYNVYYYDDNNKLVTIDRNKYTWNDETGVLVLLGDDATLRKPIYADFSAKLTHRICDGKDKEVAIRVIFNHTDDALSNALALGGEVTLEEDLLLTSSLKLKNTSGKATIINLNGHTIKNVTTGTNGSVAAIYASEGTLIIRGEGTVDGGAGNGTVTKGGSTAVYVGGNATVYIEGGNYKVGLAKDNSSSPAVFATDNAHVFISGGKFDNGATDGKFLINCNDDAFAANTCGIEITGGEYKNFNPADNPEGAGTSFVKAGYHAELAPYSLTDYVVVKD
ncbi:MAG: hypothetical protein IKU36_10210, partial [Bacteroidales bacterium]|nr:hypothetical protein [Bacteroidales bacterium]